MSKNIFIAGALALTFGSILFLWKAPSRKKEDTIILGTMSGWPPYVSLTDAGEYQGFDIDIAKEIAKKLDKKLIIKDMDTAMLMAALTQGKVDFAMTGLCITHDRLQKIAMIPYQGETIADLPLVFWDKVPEGVTSLEDIKKIPNAILCVEPGSAQENILKNYGNFTIKECNPIESLLHLKYGKALACLLEPSIFADYKAKYPQLKAITIPLDEKNKIFGNGIGIKKDNVQLIATIENIIKELKENGFIAKCELTWINEGT